MPIVISPGTGYTPTAYTQASIRQAIANYVTLGGIVEAGTDTALIAEIDDAIGASMDRLNSRQWKKWLKSQTITLVNDQATYELNTDHKDPARLMQNNASAKRDGELGYKELRTLLDEHQSATSSGQPYNYTINFSAFLLTLECPPSSGYVASYPTLTFYYFPRAYMEAAGHGKPPEFDWFVIWHGRAELASYRGDTARMQLAERQAEKQWAELVRSDDNTQTDWAV